MDKEKCGDYLFDDNSKTCILLSANSCGEASCSTTDISKCNTYIPALSTMKCIKKSEETQCEEVKRTCEEMDTLKCSDFISTDTNKKCSLNNDTKKCKEVENEKNQSIIIKLHLGLFYFILLFLY